MYIEMVDETGQVSKEMLQQTQEILEFAAQKLGKEDKVWDAIRQMNWKTFWLVINYLLSVTFSIKKPSHA